MSENKVTKITKITKITEQRILDIAIDTARKAFEDGVLMVWADKVVWDAILKVYGSSYNDNQYKFLDEHSDAIRLLIDDVMEKAYGRSNVF